METGRKFVLPNAADNLLLLNLLTARETISGDSGSNSSTMGPLLGYDGVTYMPRGIQIITIVL